MVDDTKNEKPYGYDKKDLDPSHIFGYIQNIPEYYTQEVYLGEVEYSFVVYDKDGKQYIYGDPNHRTIEDLINKEGYNLNPTLNISYKSALDWGMESSSGYLDGSLDSLIDGSFFVFDSYGWTDIDSLATGKKLYPSEAEDIILYRDNEKSNGALLIEGGVKYYLVQEALNYGWVTEEELEDIGWNTNHVFSYYILDAETKEILHRDISEYFCIVPILNIVDTSSSYVKYQIPLNVVQGSSYTHYVQVFSFLEIPQQNFGLLSRVYTLVNQPQPQISFYDRGDTYYNIPQSSFDILVVYQQISLFVIDENGITGLDGTLYEYGYKFNALMDDSDASNIKYKCEELWNGWEAYTDAQLESLGLSKENPIGFFIGKSSTVPVGTSSIKSNYYWIYGFNSSDSSNWWDPAYYALNPPPYDDSDMLSVGVDPYLEVVLLDGSGGTQIPDTFSLTTYSSFPEIYFDPEYSVYSESNGVIVKFGESVSQNLFPLPSDLYTITGTTVSWNTSHPLYNVLYGKEAYPVQQQSIEIFFGLRYANGDFAQRTFDSNDWWYSGILDATDEQTLRDFGLDVGIVSSGYAGAIGAVKYDSNYTFEPLGLYSGLRTGDLNADMSNFYCSTWSPSYDTIVTINNNIAYNTPALTWKCRITKNS